MSRHLLIRAEHQLIFPTRAFQADQRGVLRILRDAHEASAAHLAQLAQNLTIGQDDLHCDISEIKYLFDQLLVAFDGVRAEVATISQQLQRNLTRTQLDMVAIKQQLRDLHTAVATTSTIERVGVLTNETVKRVGADTLESIERLGVVVQQGFTTIEARFTSGNQPQCDQY